MDISVECTWFHLLRVQLIRLLIEIIDRRCLRKPLLWPDSSELGIIVVLSCARDTWSDGAFEGTINVTNRGWILITSCVSFAIDARWQTGWVDRLAAQVRLVRLCCRLKLLGAVFITACACGVILNGKACALHRGLDDVVSLCAVSLTCVCCLRVLMIVIRDLSGSCAIHPLQVFITELTTSLYHNQILIFYSFLVSIQLAPIFDAW